MAVRVYDRALFPDADVMADFLPAVGVKGGGFFTPVADKNDSIAFELACAVQILDPLARNRAEEMALRKQALALAPDIKGARRYLRAEHIENIRAHYRDNVSLAQRLFGRDQLFDEKKVHSEQETDLDLVKYCVGRLSESWVLAAPAK